MMKYNILPCPFCGAKESEDEGVTGVWVWPGIEGWPETGVWLVQCECGARAHYKLAKQDAIDMWNMRTGAK